MERTIRASLVLLGHDIEWLAEMLGVNAATIYRRFRDERWTLPQLRTMKNIFGWETLEG